MKRWLGLAALLALPLLMSACGPLGCDPEGYGPGWGPMMGFGWGGGMFMGMIFLILLVVAVVWWLTKGSGAKGAGPQSGEGPLDILRRRYAAGEITKEQYEAMKKDLEG